MDGTVLVADDDRTIRTVLTQALTRAGCKVHATSSLMTLMRWVDEGKGDLVISDVIMPDGNGLETLPQINEKRPGLPVIVISAQNTIMTAIQATEADAYDYLPKPFDLPDLMKRAARALDQKRRATPAPKPSRTAVAAQQEDLPLVGRTPSMQALYRLVARVMNTELPVLITGESGTGKSLIARAIHDFSDRRTLPFVVAAPSDLEGMDGPSAVIARAKGGSILFDEVGDLGRPRRARSCACSTRWAMRAAGDGDLPEGPDGTDGGRRVPAGPVLPPRRRDHRRAVLARTGRRHPASGQHFLARAERDGITARRFASDAMELIRAYSWPGNVRQLENTIRRLTVTSPSERSRAPRSRWSSAPSPRSSR
jgi:two-component system nitrogen regulation response regulator GlnG